MEKSSGMPINNSTTFNDSINEYEEYGDTRNLKSSEEYKKYSNNHKNILRIYDIKLKKDMDRKKQERNQIKSETEKKDRKNSKKKSKLNEENENYGNNMVPIIKKLKKKKKPKKDRVRF